MCYNTEVNTKIRSKAMKKAKGYICIIMCIALMLSLFGCSEDKAQADTFLMKTGDDTAGLVLDGDDNSVFTEKTLFRNLKEITESDMFRLCFSEESYGISVYDSGSDTLWKSIPRKYKGEKTGVIVLELLIDGKVYTLNSQSDSKEMGGASYETADDGICINYSFKRTLTDGTKIDITVPCAFRASDGTMSVSIDCSALEGKGNSDKVVIKSVSVLPYLATGKEGADGDFILIPDGSGAVTELARRGNEQQSFSVAVYGNDPSADASGEAEAIVPAFGMKSGDGAFVAVIDEGDAMATVMANKATEKEGFDRVYAKFNITPTLTTEDGIYVSSESYKGNIKLSYRFISKENTDYVGMATVTREMLTRNGALTTDGIKDNEYPFNLSIIGAADGKAYTDFSQCTDILLALKGKGINEINLRYKGVLSGGTDKTDAAETDFEKKLGSANDLKELYEALGDSGINVFTDVNIIRFASSSDDVALRADSKAVRTDRESFTQYEETYIGAQSVDERVNSVLYSHLESGFSGICLNDIGESLYSDFTEGDVTLRSDMQKLLSAQADSASATKRVMVENGNLYAIKYADVIVGLPDKAYYAERESFTQVPFVQTLLHGICDYSLSPVNLAENRQQEFLKAVEYGAVPYYEWYYEDNGTDSETDSRYYLNSTAEAQQQHSLAKEAFSDLRESKITQHGKVAENVYLTVYDNETEIYVNYGSEPVTVSGLTVEAMSFIRVN